MTIISGIILFGLWVFAAWAIYDHWERIESKGLLTMAAFIGLGIFFPQLVVAWELLNVFLEDDEETDA